LYIEGRTVKWAIVEISKDHSTRKAIDVFTVKVDEKKWCVQRHTWRKTTAVPIRPFSRRVALLAAIRKRKGRACLEDRMRSADDTTKWLHVRKVLRSKDAGEFISYSEWESEQDIEQYLSSEAHKEIVRRAATSVPPPGEWNDDCYLPRRIGLRPSEARDGGKCDSTRCQCRN
jgi:hypothetical protein